MKKVFGYIRVSTAKQGTGVSLQEQKEAIIRYADKYHLEIIKWFEEQETAAKQGRPLFNKMMKLLKAGKSDGVIIHKIDRSARNLRDWASLGDLIDKGVDVHFAHESLDMNQRGGRLAADIQAVIASDYIRNLREEALKGLYGRLKQGIYPFNAPTGYKDNGRGMVKTIDPVQGPLVRKAFMHYASGKYNLERLTAEMFKYGLRNLRGSPVSITSMSKILNNPFYAGVMRVKNKIFQGSHEPLITSHLFYQVQDILHGKTNTRNYRHDYLFRRMVKCASCSYSLIAEMQKRNVYYRCHTKECPTKTIRTDSIEAKLYQEFSKASLHYVEHSLLKGIIGEIEESWDEDRRGLDETLRMQERRISLKLERLTDAYIDNVIDKSLFELKKERAFIELLTVRNALKKFTDQKTQIFRKAQDFLELLKSVKLSYRIGRKDEKRNLIKSLTSNISIVGKEIVIAMKSPFLEIAKRAEFALCEPKRDRPRTCTAHFDDVATSEDEYLDCTKLYDIMQDLAFEILKHFIVLEEKDQDGL